MKINIKERRNIDVHEVKTINLLMVHGMELTGDIINVKRI